MDPISAMLGLEIDDEEKTRALADRLRGRKGAADFFSLSTIKPISSMAQAEQGDIMDSAKQAGGLRKAMAERQARQTLQDERIQADVTAADVAEGRRAAELAAGQKYDADLLGEKREYDESMADYDPYINAETGATTNVRQQGGEMIDDRGVRGNITGMIPLDQYDAPKAQSAAGTGFKRAAQEKEYNSTIGALGAVQRARDTWKSDYGNPSETQLGSVPGVGTITNAMGRLGIGTENREESGNWWGLYDKEVNIPERHEAFGAALTKTEAPLWEAATITPNMTGRYVETRLRIKERLSRRKAEKEAIKALRAGYKSAEDIRYDFGDVLPNVDEIIEMSGDLGAYEAYRNAAAEEMSGWLDDDESADAGWGEMRVKE